MRVTTNNYADIFVVDFQMTFKSLKNTFWQSSKNHSWDLFLKAVTFVIPCQIRWTVYLSKQKPRNQCFILGVFFFRKSLFILFGKKFFVASYTILNYFLHIKVTRLLSELSKIALFVDEKLGQQRLTMRPNLFWSRTWIFKNMYLHWPNE